MIGTRCPVASGCFTIPALPRHIVLGRNGCGGRGFFMAKSFVKQEFVLIFAETKDFGTDPDGTASGSFSVFTNQT